jgi:hypothetical protein
MNMRVLAWFVWASVVAGTPPHVLADELLRVDHCHTSRTTDDRAQCEKRRKDLETAYRREQLMKQLDAARKEKHSTLCFTRKSTQETVCPN